MEKAYLILADGTVFEGTSMGLTGLTVGETVFTTGMTGYIETLTDPSYYGQIVAQTFPLIGNYGVMREDFESTRSWVRGYIVREPCTAPSNFRTQGTLGEYLREQKIVGICGIDTRALTKKLRSAGVMNGMIAGGDSEALKIERAIKDTAQKEELLKEIRAYRITNAVRSVQAAHTEQLPGAEKTPGTERGYRQKHVVLIDFGAKENIRRELLKRGAKVTKVPSSTTCEQIKQLSPDGIMLSNGPGDPAENKDIIKEIQKLCETKIPIFGICLGHQMLALARGAVTQKLKYGHRGGNHPVKDCATNRVYITSQNHGYAVVNESLPPYARLRFVNANDGTCEGIDYTDIPAFSVQFHPEACSGPHDTNFLFDTFMEMIKNAAQ